MKRLALILGTLLAMNSTATYADNMPYFGAGPYDGNYWNAPHSDYPNGPPAGASSEVFNHRSHCEAVRTHRVLPKGHTVLRSERVCV